MTTGLRLARLAWGAALLAVPRRALTVVRDDEPVPVPVVRILGARQVLQALVLGGHGRAAARLSLTIDALHALSMFAAAMLNPGHRRAATASGCVAMGWVLLASGPAAARRGPGPT